MKADFMSLLSKKIATDIQEEEDRRIVEIIEAMLCCSNDGNGICSKCGLPIDPNGCPLHLVSEIMES